MYVAESQSQATAATAKFIKQIKSSCKELRSQNLRQNLFSLETQIQKSIRTHDETPSTRAASLTYTVGETPWRDWKENHAWTICLQSMQPLGSYASLSTEQRIFILH
jgi:hypothetical protein